MTRLFQFSLRALFIATAAIGAFIGALRAGSAGNILLFFLLMSLAGSLCGACIASAKDLPPEVGIVHGAIFVWPIFVILGIWLFLMFG